MSERAYPVPRPSSGEDSRFTFGLSYEVGQVLESHGFPPVRGADHVELMQALFRFIYASEALPEPRETAPLVDAPIVDEREPAEIVVREGRYGDAELDGIACIVCHKTFAVGEESAPAGAVGGAGQVFAHRLCIEILHAPMPGQAMRMTRCGMPMSRGSGVGPCTALNLTDVTCTECREALANEPAEGKEGQALVAHEGQEDRAGDPWWLVIYTRNGTNTSPEISYAIRAATAPAAGGHWLSIMTGCSGLNVAGPFDSQEEAYAYRQAWNSSAGLSSRSAAPRLSSLRPTAAP